MRNDKVPKRIRKISSWKKRVNCNKNRYTYNNMFMKMYDSTKL